jgi:hypothetical protein
VNASIRCGAPKRWDTAHVVVIGDREHRDADLGGLVDDSLGMGGGIATVGLSTKRLSVMKWVHLQGATEKISAPR